MKINKKGQEEMVGFILIVVMVVVVSVILLGILLRHGNGDGVQKKSAEVYQFLESLMGYTTDCALRYEPAYSTIGELISECHSNSAILCTNEESACDKVNQKITEILDASWKVGEEFPIKGLVFASVYSSGSSGSEGYGSSDGVEEEKEGIFNITKGVCGESFEGSEYLLSAFPGTITSELRLCY